MKVWVLFSLLSWFYCKKLFATENKSMMPMISSVWVETSREQNIGKDNPPVKIEILSFFVP